MEQSQLLLLAQIVLPSSVLDYFNIVSVESTETEIHIHLDEKMSLELSQDIHYESKGFMPATSVTDFPIRDHKVILVIRRRRWDGRAYRQKFFNTDRFGSDSQGDPLLERVCVFFKRDVWRHPW
jgi:hypothetical protein